MSRAKTAKNVTTIPATISLFTAAPINEQRKRRTAGYARVSTDSDEQFTSYEAQVDYYTNYIKSRDDWEFVDVYTDAADIIGLNQNPITTGADLVLFFLFSAKNEANGGCDCLI